MLLGMSKPIHVVVPSVTARGIVNLSALAALEAQAGMPDGAAGGAIGYASGTPPGALSGALPGALPGALSGAVSRPAAD
jgi:hypothetical protein